MTASNDNRRVRKKRGRARGSESVAKMARVLADIYASPPTANISQDDLLARLEEERVAAPHEVEHDTLPVTGDSNR
jgi:hypothetical protein